MKKLTGSLGLSRLRRVPASAEESANARRRCERTLRSSLIAAAIAGAGPLLHSHASAQGRTDYLNFEAPQVKPIAAVSIVAGPLTRRYLLACNTPDNSIEVYAIDRMELASEVPGAGGDADRGFCARIPVGLEPVSVTALPFADGLRVYTANWLGDSVTYVRLNASSEAGIDDEQALSYVIEAEIQVGDEPTCVAAIPATATDAATLIVTRRSGSSYSQLFANPVDFAPDATLDPQGAFQSATRATGTVITKGGKDVLMTNSGPFPSNQGLLAPRVFLGTEAIKEPQAVVARLSASSRWEAWVIGHKGGGSKIDVAPFLGFDPDPYNLDLWAIDLQDHASPNGAVAGFLEGTTRVGTINFSLCAGASGDPKLYVVGTDALNAIEGNDILSARPTGFVRTMLYVVTPSAFPSAPTITARDLNAYASISAHNTVAHVTDVAAYLPDVVCVAGFNSDTFAVIDTTKPQTDATALQLTRLRPNKQTVPLPFGPRGVAVDLRGASPDRAYLLNRLDNSITVIDPVANDGVSSNLFDERVLLTVPLQQDPVPTYIRDGQEFLYSTEFSATGMVSCASCHVDGRSDQLQWLLSPEETCAPLPFDVSDPNDLLQVSGVGDTGRQETRDGGFPTHDPVPNGSAHGNAKGPMITQSLQGLLNFEAAGTFFDLDPLYASLVSNAPYHWRGDKVDFPAFNEAFVNLQGAADLAAPGTQGISASDMTKYVDFVNSIHYPPNPLEPEARVFSGSFGTGSNPWNDTAPGAGSGGKRGLKLFHVQESNEFRLCQTTHLFAGRSCVQCHTLPEGSDNRITLLSLTSLGTNAPTLQPIETAALRGLLQKEGRVEFGSTLRQSGICLTTTEADPPHSGNFGLGHSGGTGLSRNEFHEFLRDGGPQADEDLEDIIQFLREFDHGVAPIVGRTATTTDSSITASLNAMEGQCNLANAGLAVYFADFAGSTRTTKGYWFDPTIGQYRRTNVVEAPASRASLIALVSAEDEMIFRSTPLGSERRIASITGVADVGSSTITNARLVGTTPNTAYLEVPLMNLNVPFDGEWTGSCPQSDDDPDVPPGLVNTEGCGVDTVPQNPLDPPVDMNIPLTLRLFDALQARLQSAGVPLVIGHDAPRRLQVTADGLLPGCKLRINFPWKPSMSPPIAVGVTPRMQLPLYPSSKLASDGRRVWETAIELDPVSLYVLMFGGPDGPGVRTSVQDGDDDAALSYGLNGITFSVQNPGGAWTSCGTLVAGKIPYAANP